MIRIITGPRELTLSIQGISVNDALGYSEVYDHILRSIKSNDDLVVIANKLVAYQWFKNMASRYPQGTFIFEAIDARGALAQKWYIDIPATVSNEDILQMGLLSSDLRPQSGFGFEDTLLAHYYTPILTSKTFPFTQLVSLLDVVNSKQWKTNLAIPLLARTLHTRLEEWKSKARSSEQRQLIELFAEDPEKLKINLMQFRVLQYYPRLGERLLEDTYDVFRTLKLQLEDLEIDETMIPDTMVQVSYYLNEYEPDGTNALLTLVKTVSGLLSIEFDAVEIICTAHPEWITPELIDQIESKFVSQNRRLSRRFKALRTIIRPSKPTLPDPNWEIDEMLSWACNTYLPYQAWCDRQEEFDPELYAIGDRFSEWLMQHWDDIHANSQRMVFNILPNIAAELKRSGLVNLVLVIDNLGWSYTEMLQELLQEQGYYLTSTTPYLAMVPSETEISKKCLLSGAVGYQAIDDKTYKAIIEKGWVPYFNDNTFRYISDIAGLKAIKTIDSTTYVVNYLAVDKALHKSSDENGMPHREHIHHLLEKLVENCVAFIEKHGLRENIRIHIVSDHGSTRIPASIPNDLDPSFFNTDGFTTLSHRFVAVSPDRFSDLADNLKLDCFFLPANDFLNTENYLCARRGNRFIATDKDVYVHGGLLPEEMIIPYMLFEPVTVPIQNLTVLLLKNDYRYRMETIELEIGNPNNAAVEQISLSILNGNVESDPFRIPSLKGKTKTSVKFNARFRQTNLVEDQTTLRLRIRFNAHSEQYKFDHRSEITMKKMVEEKRSNIFDE